jgi:hypothetical protein
MRVSQQGYACVSSWYGPRTSHDLTAVASFPHPHNILRTGDRFGAAALVHINALRGRFVLEEQAERPYLSFGRLSEDIRRDLISLLRRATTARMHFADRQGRRLHLALALITGLTA